MATAPRERWAEIEPILDRALDLPTPDRRTFLDRACSDDPSLRAEVERLLRAAASAADFLDVPALVYAAPLFAPLHKLNPPQISFPDTAAVAKLIDAEVAVRGRGGAAVHYTGLCAIQARELVQLFARVQNGLRVLIQGGGPDRFEQAVVLVAGELDSRLITVAMTARLTRGD